MVHHRIVREKRAKILVFYLLFWKSVNCCKNSTNHINGMWSKRNFQRLTRQSSKFLLYLSNVAVPNNHVGSHSAESFWMMG